jgi:hypothetical protein
MTASDRLDENGLLVAGDETVREGRRAARQPTVLYAKSLRTSGEMALPKSYSPTGARRAGSALMHRSRTPSQGPCDHVSLTARVRRTCTISGLTSGQSAPVDIVVTAPAGTYTNSVTVAQASAVTDPVTANNTAAAALTAVAPASPTPAAAKCVVTGLANVPLATAKKLLTALSCAIGKVIKSYSSKVVKGDVIKTTPGSGSYTAPKSIGIVESRGPKPKQPKKHEKPKKHHKQ